MLKNDRQKQKDSVMIKSWFINNASTVNYNTHQEKEKIKEVTPNSSNFNPFYTDKKREQNFMKGCLLMGGYKY